MNGLNLSGYSEIRPESVLPMCSKRSEAQHLYISSGILPTYQSTDSGQLSISEW